MRASRLYPMFLLLAVCVTLASGKEFTLGLLLPYRELPDSEVSGGFQGMYYAPSIIQALEDVNNRSDLLPGHHLSFIWNDTKCDETQSIQALMYLVHEKHVSAIIGPGCSCKTEARLASALDIPMVSYMCNEPLYDSVKYSTFARSMVQVELPKLSRSLVMLLRKFNWSQVAVVYENSSYYIRIKNSVVKEFEKSNINVRIQKSLPTFRCTTLLSFNISCDSANIGDLGAFFTGIVTELKQNARIVIFISDYRVSRRTLLYAHDQGMTSGDYAFIMLQLDQQQFMRNQRIPQQYSLLGGIFNDTACDYYESLEPVIVLEIKPTDTKNMTFKEFGEQVKAKFGDPIFDNVTLPEVFDVPFVAAYLYDAVFQYARALNKTLERNEATTGRNIISKMLNSGYESKSGARVFMNGDGTADFADLGIVDMRWDSSSRANHCDSNLPKAEKVGIIDVSQENPYLNIDVAAIQWPQGKKAPRDSPQCGFDGENCPSTSTGSTATNGPSRFEILIGGVCAFAGVIFIVLLVIITRHYMLKREMESLLWKINYKDISWARTNASPSIDEDDVSETSARKTSTQFTFTNFGFYKGHRVTVKQVGTKAIDLTKGILLELKQMRDFRHENCVQFFGATVDPPNICIVSAFCPRTLRDFLMCSDVRLDKTFISSLVSDIAKVMGS